MGSGKRLKAAIRKYGRSAFVKEILFFLDTEKEMNEKEKEIVTKELVADPRCYNACIGGEGGPIFAGRKHSEESKKKIQKAALLRANTISEETRKKISENNWARKDPSAQRAHAIKASKKLKEGDLAERNAKISNSLRLTIVKTVIT